MIIKHSIIRRTLVAAAFLAWPVPAVIAQAQEQIQAFTSTGSNNDESGHGVVALDAPDLLETKNRKLSKGQKNNPVYPVNSPVQPPVMPYNSDLQVCIDKLEGTYTFACCCDGGVYQATFGCDGPLCRYDEIELAADQCPNSSKEPSDCIFSGVFDARDVIDPSNCQMKNPASVIYGSYQKQKCYDEYSAEWPEDKATNVIGLKYLMKSDGNLELGFIRIDSELKEANKTRRVEAIRYSDNVEGGRSLASNDPIELASVIDQHSRHLQCMGLNCNNVFENGDTGPSNVGLNPNRTALVGCDDTRLNENVRNFCTQSDLMLNPDQDGKGCLLKWRFEQTFPVREGQRVEEVDFECCLREFEGNNYNQPVPKDEQGCKDYMNGYCVPALYAPIQIPNAPSCNGCFYDEDCNGENLVCLGRTIDANANAQFFRGRQIGRCVDLNQCMSPGQTVAGGTVPVQSVAQYTQCKDDWVDVDGESFDLTQYKANQCCGATSCNSVFPLYVPALEPGSPSCTPTCITQRTSCAAHYGMGVFYGYYNTACVSGDSVISSQGCGYFQQWPCFGKSVDNLPIWQMVSGYEVAATCGGQEALCAPGVKEDLATSSGVSCQLKI